MLGEKVRSLWERTRSVRTDDSSPKTEMSRTERAESHSKLFRCPECEVVYLAFEKDACSDCRMELTEVSATLTGE